ncbi:MAG: ABC transporter permease [Nitrospinaceae bacterium]|jgi:peptide/nickel transport system permease protein|nr:ABC transporter permease [Nitrospinaceae bacterium]MBT3434106.1 ABC transporter permease [Nitrospinaceae bacterium]MBT3820209.1 ABC transporter permease [Nitrospinaceae bacterium]MBT4095382.1 ABC transporter permease [Nitrospinaceae bacterium]MBT4432117.1 ABC transporter permease [Nitrospinaceae bacterium]
MSQSVVATPASFVEDDPQSSPWKLFWNLLRKHKVALAGGIFVLLFIVVSLSAPLIAPYNPILTDLDQALKAPSFSHPFGTDHFGRDVMSRIIYGARTSLLIGVFSVLIAAAGGILLGLLGGYFTGWTDTLIMRGMDIMLTFPRILLSILLIAIIGTGMTNIMLAVGLFAIPTYARLVRSMVLVLKETEFVESARAVGSTNQRVLFRHIFPGTLGPIVVQSTFLIATSIRVASGLSFLGIGVPPPTPEWGTMLADARSYMALAPHLITIPGLSLMAVVLSFNLLGDGLRDALDPRQMK